MNIKSSLDSQISYKINSIKDLKFNKITLDVADSFNNNNNSIINLKKTPELDNNQKKKKSSEQSKEEIENDLHFQKIVSLINL